MLTLLALQTGKVGVESCGALQVICLKLVRAFERGEQPMNAEDVPEMDDFAKQLLSRAPGGRPSNFYRAAIEDTTIISMKGVSSMQIAGFKH